MPDYRHPLVFGSFITPANNPPLAAVELARLSEQAGLDLVTFQDHPYQPSFFDTWTLLAWVAAQTERVHLAPNVMNVPMRPAAVTARAAASLDLLSGGRLDLGLGAGAFWDAMVAMGVPRLSIGEAVDALSEAIDLIRGTWDVSDPSPLRSTGHYSVDGAPRGPAPAHEIPIWLGAYKPRMLRLTGRKADGWLPTLAYLEPGDLAAGNRIIDESADAAGRDPREIRRLLNVSGRFSAATGGMLVGPVSQWIDELLQLALGDGIGSFILASDDPRTLQTFAEEVAPAVREAVAAERARAGAPASIVRSSAVRAKRREGIRYDEVPVTLSEGAVEPGDHRYENVRSTYMRGGAPGLVLRPRTTEEVVDALAFARRHPHAALSVRSAGHGISGRSTNDGGIVIDVGALNAIEVLDEANRLVRIGPGARWMDVAAELGRHGWALSSGDYGGVGVGGLATAGGIGWFARERGLTIDHLRGVEVVLADGSVVRADDRENPDLFWAVRGAGANFGIVTAFEFEVDAQPNDVAWAQLVLDAADTAGVLERWGAAVQTAPRDLTSFLILGGARPGQPRMAQVMAVVDSDDRDVIIDRLQPVADVAPLLDQSVHLMPYAQVMANAHGGPHRGRGEPNARSALVERITPAFARAAERMLESGAVYFFQLRSVGGAVADVDPDATAYAGRSAGFSVVAFGSDTERLDAAWSEIADHTEGMYLSFDTRRGDAVVEQAFPPRTLARLRELKRRFDPDNVFRDNMNIEPAREPSLVE